MDESRIFATLLPVILLLPVIGLFSLAFFVKKLRLLWAVLLVPAGWFCAAGFYYAWPVGSFDELRWVAQASLPGDRRLCLTQRRSDSEPFYYVALWSQQGNEPWKWHYIDHESNHLWDARIEYDAAANSATVYAGSKVELFELESDFFNTNTGNTRQSETIPFKHRENS